MESGEIPLPHPVEPGITVYEGPFPRAVDSVAEPVLEDNENERRRVMQLLQEAHAIQPGEHLEETGRTERELTGSERRSEGRKALIDAGLEKPWYKKLAHPLTFFKNIFSRNKYKVVSAKEEITKYQVRDETSRASAPDAPIEKAA